MASCLYTFHPRININENCKYLCRSNEWQQWEWTARTKSLGKGERVRYFNFALDIGVKNLNHVNVFVFVTKLTKGEKLKSQSILSKALRKSKEITNKEIVKCIWKITYYSNHESPIVKILQYSFLVVATSWSSRFITFMVFA